MRKKQVLQKIKTSKKVLRQDLRKLSYEEKIKRIIEMQKLSKKLKHNSSKKIYVWKLN